MKRLLALAAVLALAIGFVLMRTSTPPATERAPAETPESTETVATPLLDSSSREPARAPESDALESVAASPQPPAPGRSAASRRAPIVLTGRLTDASGKEFRTMRGRMRITDARGNAWMAPIQGDTYSLDGIAPGAFDIGVEAPGFRRVARTVTLDAHETEHREDFALDPVWTIAVRFVTTDGRNFLDRRLDRELPENAKLWAVATEVPPGDRIPPVLAEFVGRKHWAPRELSDQKIAGDPENACSGVLDVDGKPPTYVSAVVGDMVVATKLVETPVETLTIEIALDRLHAIGCAAQGSIVDATTLVPVPGVRVTLAGPSDKQCVTDGAGTFLATRLLPGDYTISILSPNHACEIRSARLAPDRVNDLGALPLEPKISLRGRFVDSQGRPVQAEADLTPFTPQAASGFWRCTIGILADESGRFEAKDCARRLYVLRVAPLMLLGEGHPDWRGGLMLVDLRKGPIDELVVTVHLPVDLVLRPTSDTVRQHRYWIFTKDGLLACYGAFSDAGVVRQKLAPGIYKLLLGEEGSMLREIPFKLGEEPTTLDVGL